MDMDNRLGIDDRRGLHRAGESNRRKTGTENNNKMK